MGFIVCMRLIYRWASPIALSNLGIRNETPKKEVTAKAAVTPYNFSLTDRHRQVVFYIYYMLPAPLFQGQYSFIFRFIVYHKPAFYIITKTGKSMSFFISLDYIDIICIYVIIALGK